MRCFRQCNVLPACMRDGTSLTARLLTLWPGLRFTCVVGVCELSLSILFHPHLGWVGGWSSCPCRTLLPTCLLSSRCARTLNLLPNAFSGALTHMHTHALTHMHMHTHTYTHTHMHTFDTLVRTRHGDTHDQVWSERWEGSVLQVLDRFHDVHADKGESHVATASTLTPCTSSTMCALGEDGV
jgi:hypothetical protein